MYFNWRKKSERPIVLESESDSASSHSDDYSDESGTSSRTASAAEEVSSPRRIFARTASGTSGAGLPIPRISSFTAGAVALPLATMNTGLPLSASLRSARRPELNESRLAQSYSGGGRLVSPASARSNRSFGSYSMPLAQALYEPPPPPTMNILVIGAPQVGKSLLINAYRAAVTGNDKWPSAPVGVCGFYGTTCVEPFPNHPTEPAWLCIDTPGRLYEGDAEVILEKLVDGMPWKTCLVGKKALTLSQVGDLIPIAANKAHQCIIVVPATDIIVDGGWSTLLQLKGRYGLADDAEGVVLYVKGLVASLRSLMEDACPFVVVTKMDKVGGCGNAGARQAVSALLSQCVPSNRIFFSACGDSQPASGLSRGLSLDPSTRESLVQLHESICFAVQWNRRVDFM